MKKKRSTHEDRSPSAREIQSSSASQRVAYIRFPDEKACVQILDILDPFSDAQRGLILETVRVNLLNYPPRVTSRESEHQFRTVVTPVVDRRSE